MVWVPKAFLEGWNRRLDLHISLLTRGNPNTIAVAGCWLVENATSSIHGNVFPVASNSLDVVRRSCACVCCGSCFLFFSFLLFCQRVSPSPSLFLCWLFRCDVMRCQWCSSVVQGVRTGSWRDVPGAVIGRGFRSTLLCIPP